MWRPNGQKAVLLIKGQPTPCWRATALHPDQSKAAAAV